MPACTPEHLFEKQLKLFQPAAGYRFSMDSLLLADRVKINGDENVLDIGTGCGILLLLLLFQHQTITATGVEIQEELAGIARKNLAINGFDHQSTIVCRDIKEITPSDIPAGPDVIIANPPYKKRSTGRLNPNLQKAVARHEVRLTLEELARSVNRLLIPGGRFYLVYPAQRSAELVCAMERHTIFAETLQFVHTKRKLPAKLVLFTGVKNSAPPLTILPPLLPPFPATTSARPAPCSDRREKKLAADNSVKKEAILGSDER
ncbi:MAG: methyltransferase [Desulfobacteraceae bacterium]